MKKAFRDELHLNKRNITRLETVNEIIEEYKEQGYRLTLRQLYYQLVVKEIIPNLQAEYAKLSGLLVKGRMAGYVDWNAIEDRIRVPFLPYWVHDIPDAINDTIESYRLNRQKDQKTYIEIWVEKDALSGVLRRITSHYHINLMVNRGYSSCTAMHDAHLRLKRAAQEDSAILYLGDHDPSGLDMVRDITNRLKEFGNFPDIEHVAITKEQIDEYNPPPNPAKISDPRASKYIFEHGDTSWEVDALDPKTLHEILHAEIKDLIDLDLFNEQVENEEEDKIKLEELKGTIE